MVDENLKKRTLYKKSPSLIEISKCVANDLNRISDILSIFKEKNVHELHIDIIAQKLKITSRQVYFYIEAGNILAGLYEINRSIVCLKTNGYFFLDHKNNTNLIKFIMNNIFKNKEIQFLIKNNYSKKMIFSYLEKETDLLNEYSSSSLLRRCGSLKSWIIQVENYFSNQK